MKYVQYTRKHRNNDCTNDPYLSNEYNEYSVVRGVAPQGWSEERIIECSDTTIKKDISRVCFYLPTQNEETQYFHQLPIHNTLNYSQTDWFGCDFISNFSAYTNPEDSRCDHEFRYPYLRSDGKMGGVTVLRGQNNKISISIVQYPETFSDYEEGIVTIIAPDDLANISFKNPQSINDIKSLIKISIDNSVLSDSVCRIVDNPSCYRQECCDFAAKTSMYALNGSIEQKVNRTRMGDNIDSVMMALRILLKNTHTNDSLKNIKNSLKKLDKLDKLSQDQNGWTFTLWSFLQNLYEATWFLPLIFGHIERNIEINKIQMELNQLVTKLINHHQKCYNTSTINLKEGLEVIHHYTEINLPAIKSVNHCFKNFVTTLDYKLNLNLHSRRRACGNIFFKAFEKLNCQYHPIIKKYS